MNPHFLRPSRQFIDRQTDKWHLSTFYALLTKFKYVCALLSPYLRAKCICIRGCVSAVHLCRICVFDICLPNKYQSAVNRGIINRPKKSWFESCPRVDTLTFHFSLFICKMPYRPERSLRYRGSGNWEPRAKSQEDPELISEQIEERRTFDCLPRLSNIVAIYPCSNRNSLIQAIVGFLPLYRECIAVIWSGFHWFTIPWRPLKPEESVLMAINCRQGIINNA